MIYIASPKTQYFTSSNLAPHQTFPIVRAPVPAMKTADSVYSLTIYCDRDGQGQNH
jgi:hypothetical protein